MDINGQIAFLQKKVMEEKREIFEKIPDLPVFNLKVTFNSDFFYHADRGNKNT